MTFTSPLRLLLQIVSKILMVQSQLAFNRILLHRISLAVSFKNAKRTHGVEVIAPRTSGNSAMLIEILSDIMSPAVHYLDLQHTHQIFMCGHLGPSLIVAVYICYCLD